VSKLLDALDIGSSKEPPAVSIALYLVNFPGQKPAFQRDRGDTYLSCRFS